MNLIGINFNAESLGKIKEFYLDSSRVCSLFEKYLKSSKKTDEEDFMEVWTQTIKNKENYFLNEGNKSNYPNQKMIVLESNLFFETRLKELHQIEEKIQILERVAIFYDLNDNQNGELSKNGFPYLGIFVAACFYNHEGQELFKIAIAGTENNCDLVKPIIDFEQSTIKIKEKTITFISDKDFNNLLSLFKEITDQINDFVGGGFVTSY